LRPQNDEARCHTERSSESIDRSLKFIVSGEVQGKERAVRPDIAGKAELNPDLRFDRLRDPDKGEPWARLGKTEIGRVAEEMKAGEEIMNWAEVKLCPECVRKPAVICRFKHIIDPMADAVSEDPHIRQKRFRLPVNGEVRLGQTHFTGEKTLEDMLSISLPTAPENQVALPAGTAEEENRHPPQVIPALKKFNFSSIVSIGV
jgi:hypothetical protein